LRFLLLGGRGGRRDGRLSRGLRQGLVRDDIRMEGMKWEKRKGKSREEVKMGRRIRKERNMAEVFKMGYPTGGMRGNCTFRMPNPAPINKHNLRKTISPFFLTPLKQSNQMLHLPKRKIKRNILLRYLHDIISLILQCQFREFENRQHCTGTVCVFEEGYIDAGDVL
jgi:hypothetical protein